MNKRILTTAAVCGLIAVILGAFGAHGLSDRVSVQDLENWKTGINYQFYHTLALLALSGLPFSREKIAKYTAFAFIAGILLFSGSLYLLATRSITGIGTSILGPVTPLGGLCFITGWILLLIASLKRSDA